MADDKSLPLPINTLRRMIDPLTELVARAGEAILSINRATMACNRKLDGSDVTEADLASDSVISKGIGQIAPDIPVISEEQADRATTPQRGSFFLVDPLDGTKEFLAGRDEYTVNIALVSGGVPLLGVVGAPALGLIWRGIVGAGAERLTVNKDGTVERDSTSLKTRALPVPPAPSVICLSRSHGDPRTEAFIAERPGATRLAAGSSVKFCRIAEGVADIYPRLSPTSEWDIAAGHALLTAAGGIVTDAQGHPLQFGLMRNGLLVPDFIAWGDPAACHAAQ